MQIKTFRIGLYDAERIEAEINLFLRSHRVLRVEHHFVENDGGVWRLLVEYQDEQPDVFSPVARRKNKIDFTEDMTDEQKRRYEQMRKIRSSLSKERGVPAYVIFTNEELSILAREPELNEETAKSIKGIAPSRVKDSIGYFLDNISDNVMADEAGGSSD